MWFLAMSLVTSQKNGVSALGLQRVLGLDSYETAWTWLHKLRRAMVDPAGIASRVLSRSTKPMSAARKRASEDGKSRPRPSLWWRPRRAAAASAASAFGASRMCAGTAGPFVQGAWCPVLWFTPTDGTATRGWRRPATSTGHRHQERGGTGARGHAAHPYGRLAAQAVADRHAPRRHPAPASRLLPR